MGSAHSSGVKDPGHIESRNCIHCNDLFLAKVDVVTIKGTHSESFCPKCAQDFSEKIMAELNNKKNN